VPRHGDWSPRLRWKQALHVASPEQRVTFSGLKSGASQSSPRVSSTRVARTVPVALVALVNRPVSS
jgi:hypothetical protein